MNSDIGLIGLAVMGSNLARNMARNGYKVSVFNRSMQRTDELIKAFPSDNLVPFFKLIDFINSLSKPRKIFLMVKAGLPVDKTIEDLLPYLDKGDLVIDGGNSYYKDTIRRENNLLTKDVLFMGCGVSGGEEGALNGPSLMPGGSKKAYALMKNILISISAKAPDPCVTHIGTDGAGHFVKMVHNGIEYGDMQLISEAYHIFKLSGLTNNTIADIFSDWNKSELNSFLIEITEKVLRKKDKSGQFLVDLILDKAGQKGTGKWTSIEAMQEAVALSTISSAVDARYLSANKDLRKKINTLYKKEKKLPNTNQTKLASDIKAALYASKIISYAQGLSLIKKVSDINNWNIDLSEIAKIWRGGCIIRAIFLNDIASAYKENPNIENLIMASNFQKRIVEREEGWRNTVSYGVHFGIPLMAMTSALSYFDSLTSENLPANLIQAQRDYFGAHTFERIDQEGIFHINWEEEC